MCDGKPVCAATIRVSLGYLEVRQIHEHDFTWYMTVSPGTVALCLNALQVPFFATHETKRKRGYGRALIEAIEEV